MKRGIAKFLKAALKSTTEVYAGFSAPSRAARLV
jgi:hypothetical protein